MKKFISGIMVFFVFVIACNKPIPFDSMRWKECDPKKDGIDRNLMLNSLIESNFIEKKSYADIIKLLGAGENGTIENINEKWYLVDIDYGCDIDPRYIKHLVIYFTNGYVDHYKIDEYNRLRFFEKIMHKVER